jgi:hypothetical protein
MQSVNNPCVDTGHSNHEERALVGGEVDKSLPNILSYPMEVDIENE